MFSSILHEKSISLSKVELLMKLKSLFCFFLYAFLLFGCPTTKGQSDLEKAIFADEFEAQFLHNLDDFADDVKDIPHITRQTSEETLLDIIGNESILNTLKTPFYHLTWPLVDRSIDSDPLFQSFPNFKIKDQLQLRIFFNQTSKGYFVDEETGIQTYLNMRFSDSIQRIADVFMPEIRIDRVFRLFDEAKVQERNFGLMGQFYYNFNDVSLTMTLPFMYQERNFFLDKHEREAIENEPLFRDFDGDYMEFAREHLISDRFGIGDLKMYAERPIFKQPTLQYWIGVQGVIPTAFSIAQGLYGNYFNKNAPEPKFNLHSDLMNPGTAPAFRPDPNDPDYNPDLAKTNAQNFLVGGLDRLSTILLQRPLGNGRHFVFGPYFRSEFTFNDKVTLTTKTSFSLYTPWIERRFFRKKIDIARIDEIADNPPINEIQARESIAYLSDVVVDKLYPLGYDVQVWPGVELESTSRLEYNGRRAVVIIGGDLWFRTKERFVKIHGPTSIYTDFFVDQAKRPYGYQTSIWFSVKRNPKSRRFFEPSFECQSSVFSTGIGERFTVALTLSHTF